MDRTHLRRQALTYLTAAALALTLAFAVFVIDAKPPAREPAARPAASDALADDSSRAYVVHVPCWEKTASITPPPPGTRWVRLVGKVCGKSVDLDAVSVTNDTNHYLATIFPSAGQLTTDLIQLAPGANDLRISVDHVVQHVALTR
jgi:hypothetical protein